MDKNPEDDVVYNEEGNKIFHREMSRALIGDNKVGDDKKHYETPHYQLKGEKPDERQEEFVLLIIHTIEQA